MRRADSARAREALDRRFQSFGPPGALTPPQAGWVRAIRDALGMPAAALAARMGVTEPAVFSLEKNEQHGTARLDTLRRAAEALDCTLVYALVPKETLQAGVRRRAELIAESGAQRAGHSMALEDQAVEVAANEREKLIERIAASKGLWSKP